MGVRSNRKDRQVRALCSALAEATDKFWAQNPTIDGETIRSAASSYFLSLYVAFSKNRHIALKTFDSDVEEIRLRIQEYYPD